MTIAIRAERAGDETAISALIELAFAGAPHASGTEALIIEQLRTNGDLAAAFVAVEGDRIVGQVAFSPVRIDGAECNWFGLGPVAVEPNRQGEGIGRALIEHGLRHLKKGGACGCVVLGDPGYYARFGFVADPALRYPGSPAEYFQRLVMQGEAPSGTVAYAPAFD